LSRYLKAVFALALYVQLFVVVAAVASVGRYIGQGNVRIWELLYAGIVLLRHMLTVYLIFQFKRFFESTQLVTFTGENALKLQKIANAVLLLGLVYAVETYPQKLPQAVELFATSFGSLKGGVLAFIIFGLFIRHIASIFQAQSLVNTQ